MKRYADLAVVHTEAGTLAEGVSFSDRTLQLLNEGFDFIAAIPRPTGVTVMLLRPEPYTAHSAIVDALRSCLRRSPATFPKLVELVRANMPIPEGVDCPGELLLDPSLSALSTAGGKAKVKPEVDDDAPWPVHPLVRDVVLRRVVGIGLETRVLAEYEPDAEPRAEPSPPAEKPAGRVSPITRAGGR